MAVDSVESSSSFELLQSWPLDFLYQFHLFIVKFSLLICSNKSQPLKYLMNFLVRFSLSPHSEVAHHTLIHSGTFLLVVNENVTPAPLYRGAPAPPWFWDICFGLRWRWHLVPKIGMVVLR